MTYPRVSVVVATFHGGSLLGRCLASLGRQDPPPDEVVVSVSHGADVATVAIPAGGVPTRVILAPRPLHYGATVNRGLGDARGRWVLVLNDDARLHPGALGALLEAARSGGPGLYQPRILLGDGSGRLDNVGHGLFPDGLNMARGRNRADGPEHDRPGTVAVVSGAAFLADRELLDALGGFDEQLGPFGEDADLSLRAVRRGWPLRYVPEARVDHDLGASYGRQGLAKIYRVERNRVRLALRSLPATLLPTLPAWTLLRWTLMAGAAAGGRGLGAGLGPMAGLAAVAGASAGWLHLPGACRRRRQDRDHWTRGELEMLTWLWRERVRRADLGLGRG